MQKTAFLVFPNQLFERLDLLHSKTVFLVEEFLFFSQYAFHKQKLVYHKASIAAYADFLQKGGIECRVISCLEKEHDVRNLIPELKNQGFFKIEWYDTVDNWLEKRIANSAEILGLSTERHSTPMFMNARQEVLEYKPGAKKFFQTEYYIQQRKKWNILIESDGGPVGGKWTFDADNRKKYPQGKKPPVVRFADIDVYYEDAIAFVSKNFPNNPGEIDSQKLYPIHYRDAELWLERFFQERFAEFGEFEDAIVTGEHVLHHSLITPMLNTGLLLPDDVVQHALAFARKYNIPLNSLEGFLRQIIGWREFIRMIYIRSGSVQRTKNYWGFTRKIPASFYTASTGIFPIDQSISKLLKTGYNHHIERLMILSNFMLLCEIDPDEVYRWFMEMYIDAYDWVMVPNVYGMAQFADGGMMCTKPYISGSNYILKMSDYKKDESWTEIWDALFWRFMHVHRDFFGSNPRLAMLLKTFDKWPVEKKDALLTRAENYLKQL